MPRSIVYEDKAVGLIGVYQQLDDYSVLFFAPDLHLFRPHKDGSKLFHLRQETLIRTAK